MHIHIYMNMHMHTFRAHQWWSGICVLRRSRCMHLHILTYMHAYIHIWTCICIPSELIDDDQRLIISGTQDACCLEHLRHECRDPALLVIWNVCMYVCMHTHIYMYECRDPTLLVIWNVFMYVCTHTHTHMNECRDPALLVIWNVCTCVCMYVCMYTHTYMYECRDPTLLVI